MEIQRLFTLVLNRQHRFGPMIVFKLITAHIFMHFLRM